MSTIYRESMISDVFMWDAASNNRAFLWGQASIIQNAISAIRSMEKSNPALARKVVLAPPAAGPGGRLAPANVLHCYVVWKFSDKAELAKRFLIDLVAAGEDGIPRQRVLQPAVLPPGGARPRQEARRGKTSPAPRKSGVRASPGPLRAPRRGRPLERPPRPSGLRHAGGRRDACSAGVIPAMFARAARGEQSPEASVRAAEVEMRRIFARWSK